MSASEAATTVDWLAHRDLSRWLASGRRGISSNAIVSHITGVVPRDRFSDHPRDPSDFVRCEQLLREVPLLRLFFFPAMSGVSPVWHALVDRWDELVALIDEEVPGAFDGKYGDAPRAYALMQELRTA